MATNQTASVLSGKACFIIVGLSFYCGEQLVELRNVYRLYQMTVAPGSRDRSRSPF